MRGFLTSLWVVFAAALVWHIYPPQHEWERQLSNFILAAGCCIIPTLIWDAYKDHKQAVLQLQATLARIEKRQIDAER